jgi:hypothetical protein
LQVESSYNKVLRRYEIFIVPNISYSEAQLNITSEDIHIFGSPFTVKIRPGPYSLKDSEWIEWNGGPLGKKCVINIDCNIKFTLKDRNHNIVNEPYVLSSDDADIVMIGP